MNRSVTALVLALLFVLPLAAGGAAPPAIKVHFNQETIEGASTEFDITDTGAVFELVFSQLPETVRVYPTENYYYFNFAANGQTVYGNLRLDARDRDKGVIHLGYFRFDESGRFQDRVGHTRELTAADGVTVERRGAFEYTVTSGGRTVRFLLNEIGMAPPKRSSLRESEVFVGPVFDDSGLAFFLVFDREEKHFFYMLNEERRVPEKLETINDAVAIGRRTGFAFFNDRELRRKILIGVHHNNATRNNHYDGPFDQLPDNYVEQTRIQQFIEEAYPEAKGLVDRFGVYVNQPGARLVIIPYIQYKEDKDLDFVLACQEKKGQVSFMRCITPDLQQTAVCRGGNCVGPQILGETTLTLEIPAQGPPPAQPPG
jgi:hypothetical protein